jgi:integrase
VRALRHGFAKHLDRPAEDLDVVHALDSLSRRRKDKGGGTKPPHRGIGITGRTAAYGRACFAWAMKRGTVRSNPFAELPWPTAITKRDRVLSDEEAAAIWRAAGEAAPPYGTIVRLLMLTGQRREEVAGMTWTELSEDLVTWTIPGTRTKNGVPHLVPLSRPARELLHGLLSEGPDGITRAPQDRRAKLALILPGERGTPLQRLVEGKVTA